MQIYFNFVCKFFRIIVHLAWVRLSTHASRLLQKCHERYYLRAVVIPAVFAVWQNFQSVFAKKAWPCLQKAR